jgi:hypothetical protein
LTGVRHTQEIPDEYETTSGHGLAMNNAGTAANDPFSAIRENPALLATSKQYTVNGGYHWPTAGRDYYQAGIVDSKSAPVAVGISYTGFMDDYVSPSSTSLDPRTNSAPFNDSPVLRRGVVGVAEGFGNFMVGAGATYVEAHTFRDEDPRNTDQDTTKGFGLNLGAALALNPQWSFGASVENASNKQISEYEPMIYRLGAAYLIADGITAYVDFRQRDRVQEFEGPIAQPVLAGDPKGAPLAPAVSTQPERMLLGSLTAQVQEFLKLVGSYGQSVTDPRRSLAGGAALVNKNFSLSYTLARPYMSNSATHQAVTLSLEMAI